MNDDNLDPRLRQSAFRRYEGVIAAIVKHYPREIPLHVPSSIGMATFRARLRDAMLSLSRHNWPSTVINKAKFHENYEDIGVFSGDDGSITAGSKKAKRAGETFDTVVDQLNSVTAPVINLADYNDPRHLICYLAHLRLISAVPLIVRGIAPDEIAILEGSYDVSLKALPDGTTSVI